MMRKWLIRTNSNQVFGPVSKEKILEFYHDQTIGLEDEICSGNGFWFYLREEELKNRFLLGDEEQPFNPISEAKDVLQDGDLESQIGDRRSKDPDSELSATEDAEEVQLPSQEDLEFPEGGSDEDEEEDITLMKNLSSELLNLKSDQDLNNNTSYEEIHSSGEELEGSSATLNLYESASSLGSLEESFENEENVEEVVYPDESDLDYPDLKGDDSKEKVIEGNSKPLTLQVEKPSKKEELQNKNLGKEIKSSRAKNSKVAVKQKDDRYLVYLMILLLAALGYTLYKKANLIEGIFSLNRIEKIIFSTAFAQTSEDLKKKVFLS